MKKQTEKQPFEDLTEMLKAKCTEAVFFPIIEDKDQITKGAAIFMK